VRARLISRGRELLSSAQLESRRWCVRVVADFWLEAVESIRCAKEQLSVPRVAASSEDVLPHRIVGDPLTAEISQTQARTVEYQATIAKPRWPSFSPRRRRDVDDFSFDGTPINETYAVLRHLPPGIGEQNRGTQTRYGRWKARPWPTRAGSVILAPRPTVPPARGVHYK
jgi:hypothetical protein